MKKSRLRLVFALVLLATSVVLLAWSFLPGPRVLRRQRLQPTEMQLPTPSSYLPLYRSLAWEAKLIEAQHAAQDAARLVLIL